MTLDDLINECGANAFVLADAGNGSAYGGKGCAIEYDGGLAARYGGTRMTKLASPHVADDGTVCCYSSDWIVEGDGDNPYRVMIFF